MSDNAFTIIYSNFSETRHKKRSVLKMDQLIQSFVSTNVLLATFSDCFSTILKNSEFQTVGLVNTNQSSDLASDLHREIASKTNFAWKIYNMDMALEHNNLKAEPKEKMFLIFVLKHLAPQEFNQTFHFLRQTRTH